MFLKIMKEILTMPIYEYVCNDCGKRYEQIVLSRKQKLACPSCSSGRHTLQLSVFSAHSNSSGGGTGSTREAAPGGSCGCGPGGCGRN
jgi:putative FmdB family regulatory protein